LNIESYIKDLNEVISNIPEMAEKEPLMLAVIAVLFLLLLGAGGYGIYYLLSHLISKYKSAPAQGADAGPPEKEKSENPATEPPPEEEDESKPPSDTHLMDSMDKLNINKRQKKKTPKSKKPKKQLSPKKSAKELKKKAKPLKIPKSAQQTIPYIAVYEEDGIIETKPGTFTKSYKLGDVNYQIARQEEQEDMFFHYGEFLNSLDANIQAQITFSQHNINMTDFEKETLLPLKSDNLDDLRTEQNTILKKKIQEGKNNLIIEKFLTLSVDTDSLENAQITFSRLDTEVATNIGKIGGASATPLSTVKRLEILHDIYNQDALGLFGNNMVRIGEKKVDGQYVPVYDFAPEKFSFDIMRRMGLTTKDMIAPDGFVFKNDYGMTGNKYFRALYIKTLPTFLGDSVLSQLTTTDCNMLTSIILEPVETDKALKQARNQITNINTSMVDLQKKASKSGYSTELISPELKDAAEEANALLKDLTSKNQKLFMMTLVIVHFADTKEQLDADTQTIKSIGRRMVLNVLPLQYQQERGLASALPLCHNQLYIKRSLTTESAAVFMPFVNQELNEPNGMYYGINAVSHNLIRFNRRKLKNGNGFILGTPGSGKSMSAKFEMLSVLLSTDDVVIVIDPEGEYYPMAEMLSGEVVRIAPGSEVHINPFDINLTNHDSTDDPLANKSDFIVSLCENTIGGNIGLSPAQRSIIDRCVHKVYEPYLNSFDYATGKYNSDLLPTLKDFYNSLRDEHGWDALNLADSLEIYAVGSQDVFAYQTNVEYSERFVVYDIKDIGQTMTAMGLLVVLDNVWNRIVEGRNKGKNVWIFIDEIYLLFKNPSSAEYLRNLYKRARKYGAIPTGITQNVSDILESDIARTMITNSEHIMMLNQGQQDCAQLMKLLGISPSQANYITKSSPGEGLIFNGSVIVPFINKLPKDTKMYEAMTTKLSEVKAREDKKRQEAEALASAGKTTNILLTDEDEFDEDEPNLYEPTSIPEDPGSISVSTGAST